MEARVTFRGGRMSVGFMVAVIALVVAFVLGGTSGYIAKALTIPASTTTTQYVEVPAPSPKLTILPNQA
jgi:ABC-type dipeptide/oligopeptide/nickel transport system permease subunit